MFVCNPGFLNQRWEFIKENKSKRTRKQELDQESNQENKRGILLIGY